MNFVLEHPTKNEILEILGYNYLSWGTLLSKENYLKREDRLDKTLHSVLNRKWWILTNGEQEFKSSNGNRVILSSCETYSHPGKVGTVLGKCLAIGSVFTFPTHRKKGYASRMLAMMMDEFAKMPGVIATTLFNDLENEFYSKLGWNFYKSTSLINLMDGLNTDNENVGNVAFLSISRACERLENEKIREFESKSPDNTFTAIPTGAMLEWHLERSLAYHSFFGIQQPISHLGVEAVGTDEFIIWSYDFVESRLNIVYHMLKTKRAVKLLLSNAVKEAKVWALKSIEMWEPPTDAEVDFGALGWVTTERRLSLASIRVFSQIEPDNFVWKNNMKLFWC